MFPRRYFLCGPFVLFMLSVHCCLVVTCWEGADLLAPVCDVSLCFVTFPCGILGQVWYLIVSIPDLCPLSYCVICIILQNIRCSFLSLFDYYMTLLILQNTLIYKFQHLIVPHTTYDIFPQYSEIFISLNMSVLCQLENIMRI